MSLDQKGLKKRSVTVAYFFENIGTTHDIKLRRLNSVDEQKRRIFERDLHRPGLALSGFTNLFTYKRVQILGNTETRFLNHLGEEERRQAFDNLVRFKVPCIILTSNNKLQPDLLEMATEQGIPVFVTRHSSTKAIYQVTDFLDDQFSLYQQYHGSMVDVYGVGVLLIGKSGLGKSEIALDLVERGHGLVADDVVVIRRKGESMQLSASRNNIIDHFMEIRGLGVVDVKANFGIRAIRDVKEVLVVAELLEWNKEMEYERLGLDTKSTKVLGVDVPLVQLPIFPGKNITVIIEVVALNVLLKRYSNYVAAEALTDRIKQVIKNDERTEGEIVL
ncbi:HPr kinase/phosphorylase [Chlorobium phaeovibrioides]|uniref:HPr kinase/phosphorylase n=2 Tax=Chlorobium phaeovibrioides TaxID=1094 RepID=HPRK_CHLPM|nr:HPr(Ser) kinase/phosphatase [Chlorobium phaeovibrioides]A4SG14.1 RecName: Full=HPr kinase/phosphorylase; Short=HPrK/P; AltName: Full=HPr(Ser) kinase/phosphorylase [Chlorobium phaeovibrioides DSM 265]HCD36079.1 HPr kinase/phosphorylase [Chlorobium sp.]KAA6233038.1 HPr kinase/phosphorylase [Chlorobium phaeovibrioides]MWV53615.1 HPr kinase/phosphorylase [Chlorobium phaeovibrioides]QEQ56572.1 HPr kinase/phosphorylase [Chlorobium phaeovibrioides]RTY35867.1 HPr kinase/phosphorylase [Chlorobium p